jgi:hypothetical protein
VAFGWLWFVLPEPEMTVKVFGQMVK